jgi:hypothetical protein
LGKTLCFFEGKIQIAGNNRFLSAADLGDEGHSIWGEYVLDLTGRDDIERVQLELAMEIPLSRIGTAYDIKRSEDYFQFGVRIWNKGTRWREFREGTLTLKPKAGGRKAKIGCNIKIPIDVREFSGEIEIEPIVTTRPPTLLDTDRNILLATGSLMAWSEPIVITLDRVRKGIDSLFEFHWISFTKPPSGLEPPSNSFFFVKWEPRPKLYLNLDVENLQRLLVSDSKAGISHGGSVRRAVNSIIAHQILSTGLSAAVQQARQHRLDDPDGSGEDLLSGLDEQNRSILRGWVGVLGGDVAQKPEEQLLALLDLDADEVTARIAEQIPSGLQSGLGTRKAVENLIAVVSNSLEARVV